MIDYFDYAAFCAPALTKVKVVTSKGKVLRRRYASLAKAWVALQPHLEFGMEEFGAIGTYNATWGWATVELY